MPEAPSTYYDTVFAAGKYETGRDFYWDWALRVLDVKCRRNQRGLDIGCGPGGFLEKAYKAGWTVEGLDFSQEAIRQASVRTPHAVRQGDIWTFSGWIGYDFFTIMETLEHVERDLDFIRSLPPGRFFLATVPSWGDPSHVRAFPDLDSVVRRYSEALDAFVAETVAVQGLWGFYGTTRGNP